MTITPASPPSFFQKLLAALLGMALLVLGFMFSLVILSIVAVVIVIGGGYFFWKTRGLRKAMRAAAASAAASAVNEPGVIEGEATVIRETATVEKTILLIEEIPVKLAKDT
jgi:O-antigen ligase